MMGVPGASGGGLLFGIGPVAAGGAGAGPGGGGGVSSGAVGAGHLTMMPPFAMYPPYMYGYPPAPGAPMPGWDPHARWNGPHD
jgi:hypothetical protein